jgi:phage shock protein A
LQETIAIDGTKKVEHIMANFNQKKIERHFGLHRRKTQEYLDQLDQNDSQESSSTISKIQEKIARLKTNKIGYEILQEKLKASGIHRLVPPMKMLALWYKVLW